MEISIKPGEPLYKQEGRTGLFQILLPFEAFATGMLKYLPRSWGESWGWMKENYTRGVFYENNFAKVTEDVLRIAHGGFPEIWRDELHKIDTELTATAQELVGKDLSSYSLDELQKMYREVYELDHRMWSILIFIDCFDPGYDQREIARILEQHGLSVEEAHVLTTPAVQTFVRQWDDAITKFKRGETSFEGLREKFFWYATSYSEFGELTEEFVRVAADESHSAPRVPSSDSERKILRTHGLSKNPLEFFKELTFWRDERKRLNYTGLYGLLKILREVFRRQAIELALVNSLAPWEAIDVFEKDIPVAELETRMHEGFFLHITEEGKIEFAVGEEGKQYWAQVATRLSQSTSGEIKGTVASRGMARGIVHVIYDFADPKAVHFKSGDILVTAMTRPEFMPLIRKAAAIVTDEGGITSHAAIVSRELGKPCIIGTRNASQLLKDGDMVEVDAEKGIVRKLEK